MISRVVSWCSDTKQSHVPKNNAPKGAYIVPRAGIEPARAKSPADFESAASTSFTTPALKPMFRFQLSEGQKTDEFFTQTV
jgi:hypothetical protein